MGCQGQSAMYRAMLVRYPIKTGTKEIHDTYEKYGCWASKATSHSMMQLAIVSGLQTPSPSLRLGRVCPWMSSAYPRTEGGERIHRGHHLSLRGSLNVLKTIPVPNKAGSYGIRVLGFVCRSLNENSLSLNTTSFTPYDPSFHWIL